MRDLECPVCGNALAACCTATVLLRESQRDRKGPAKDPQIDVAGPANPVAHVLGSKASKPQPKYTTEFLTFWSTYPRKKDKASAFRAFAVAVRGGADPQTLIAGAAKYATDPQRKDDFTKYPATWLNARAWEDEEDKPVDRNGGKVRSEYLLYGSPEWKAANPS